MKNPHHVLVNKNCPVQGLTRQELSQQNNPVRSDHVREGNALQVVSRWFRRIQRILRFHIDKYQPHRERFISDKKTKTFNSHDCKRQGSRDPMSRCNAIQVRNTPPC